MTTNKIPRVCSIDSCGKPQEARSFCKMHYQRFRHHGNPHIRLRVPIAVSPICSVRECGRKHFAKTFCARHYTRFRKYGDPLFTQIEPAEVRFWANVEKTDGCWLWMGTRQDRGYGMLSVEGRQVKAHRYSYFLAHGKWPENLACHTCDNPPCVNPAHLYDGTSLDNAADRMNRGRFEAKKGEENNRSKLKEVDVIEIRRLLAEGFSQRLIASQYGVNQRVIWAIHNRKSWTHI